MRAEDEVDSESISCNSSKPIYFSNIIELSCHLLCRSDFIQDYSVSLIIYSIKLLIYLKYSLKATIETYRGMGSGGEQVYKIPYFWINI